MPQLSVEELAKRAAARAALQPPTISPARQALADAQAHERQRKDAVALKTATAPISAEELPDGWVLARVLRHGHDKIYTGQIDGTEPDAAAKFTRYSFGDVIPLPGKVALAQENNGNAEVLPEFRKSLGLLAAA